MTDPNPTKTFNDGGLNPTPGMTSSGAAYNPNDAALEDGVDHPAREQGLRGAVRSDFENGRDWARQRAERARVRIADRPVESTVYALGVGVLIGLLLRR
ncbi:hypothetical protein [Brevundimonas sp. R86498]|uniref:hypothetical protein n=1 Tax=Brevundimonas sp. R86498 TaxID=3093845 RepID=UPI0037C938D6